MQRKSNNLIATLYMDESNRFHPYRSRRSRCNVRIQRYNVHLRNDTPSNRSHSWTRPIYPSSRYNHRKANTFLSSELRRRRKNRCTASACIRPRPNRRYSRFLRRKRTSHECIWTCNDTEILNSICMLSMTLWAWRAS